VLRARAEQGLEIVLAALASVHDMVDFERPPRALRHPAAPLVALERLADMGLEPHFDILEVLTVGDERRLEELGPRGVGTGRTIVLFPDFMFELQQFRGVGTLETFRGARSAHLAIKTGLR